MPEVETAGRITYAIIIKPVSNGWVISNDVTRPFAIAETVPQALKIIDALMTAHLRAESEAT